MTTLSTQIIKIFWEKLLLTCVLVHYKARFRFVLIRVVVPWLMPEFCVRLERLKCILVFIYRVGAVSEHCPGFGSQNRQQLHVTKSVDLWDNLGCKYFTPTVPHYAINSIFAIKNSIFGAFWVNFGEILLIFGHFLVLDQNVKWKKF